MVWRIVLRVSLEQRRPREQFGLDAFNGLGVDPGLVDQSRDPEIAAALRSLSPRRRLIVFLRYFADLDYQTIAEICQIDPGTVAATLAQARAALARSLTQKEVEVDGTH